MKVKKKLRVVVPYPKCKEPICISETVFDYRLVVGGVYRNPHCPETVMIHVGSGYLSLQEKDAKLLADEILLALAVSLTDAKKVGFRYV